MVSAPVSISRPPSYGAIATKDGESSEKIDAVKGYHHLGDSHHRVEEQWCLAAWFTYPYFKWRPRWYFTTIRGAEWFHVYLWLLKDLSWTQDWNYLGIFSGFAAVFWSLFLMFQVILDLVL
mmetsp:Transcript_28467/g.75027  ORF Transcript_28467/g.75027 Transcript_28467/m.75027 type:complete len:121 (+) Transcript_28467:91-453(+)